jgi:hypothetical protein
MFANEPKKERTKGRHERKERKKDTKEKKLEGT